MRHPQPALRSRVLLVESNAIIGLDLAEQLEALGYTVSGPFAEARALEHLKASTPDLAILDADLRSGICVELARELRGRGVPMLVFSCYDQSNALPEFRNLPWLPMPAPITALHAALGLLAVSKGRVAPHGTNPTRRLRAKGGRASPGSPPKAAPGRKSASAAK